MTKRREPASLGQQLIEAAREAVEIERGNREPARITRVTAADATVPPPPPCPADRIRAIRDALALSQPVFAAALNVSAETVRAWEQGKRSPDGAALRLLEVAAEHPEVMLGRVRARAEEPVVVGRGGSDG
jgi:putative transcriptional regulator